jgi:polysaccharide biosynthesis/export protein
MKTVWTIFSLATAASLSACSTLPHAGPTRNEIADQAANSGAAFTLVEIDGRVLSTLGASPPDAVLSRFESEAKPASPAIGVGDTVSVTIWQAAGSASVLGPGSGLDAGGANGVLLNQQLPPQVVGPDGTISVPYAGRVHAVGHTTGQIEQTIERLLASRLIEPQVIVTVPNAVAQAVTVSSESIGAVRVPLSPRGDRLLDVIAAAGGAKSPLYENVVRLSREGQVTTIPLAELTDNGPANVYAHAGDVISLIRAPQTFSVFGATFNNAELPFNSANLSLAQAIARAGGLQDSRSDPAGVYLFRFEPEAAVTRIGAAPRVVTPEGRVPVVYHLDLQDIGGYFLAKRFALEDGDMIYVANAGSDSVQKFFTLVGTLSSPIISGVVVTRGTQ